MRTGTRSNNGKQSYVIIFINIEMKNQLSVMKRKGQVERMQKEIFEDDREFVEQIINEKTR